MAKLPSTKNLSTIPNASKGINEKKSGKSLPGVFRAQKKDGTVYYRSSFTYHGKHISLGSFATEKQANIAYRTAHELFTNPQLTIESHSKATPLSFEKWVVLINYRDNGIYISNPIYIRPKMFYYYLSPDEILKFDADDLFYYSSHKIMKRGGHLFVADYGMQINIASRYGIRNYAVEGRDYLFKNGDSLDYRYQNIHLINTYHGVTKAEKNGKATYRAVIHINGNYKIGIYPTAIEAAIAYNKAIDCLAMQGITKNYTVNFIDEISPSEYATLYSKIKISSKIQNFRS